jgi:hypothetical protein
VRRLAAISVVALASVALAGIQQTVAVALERTPGGVTTVITMGVALLGVWAIAVLREE